MKKILLRIGTLLLCAVILLPGCAGEKAATPDSALENELQAGTVSSRTEENGTGAQTVKEELRAIIEKERGGLREEMEKILLADPDYQQKKQDPPEGYEEYRALMTEMEENMIGMTGDKEKDQERIDKGKELERKVTEIDPDGACRRYEENVNAAFHEFAMNAYYYTDADSPYMAGFVEEGDGTQAYYAVPGEAVITMKCPQGMFAYAAMQTAVTMRYKDEGTSMLDMSEMYTPEHFEKFPEERTREQNYIVFEVTECYYGDCEKGDLLFFVPRMLDPALTEELKEGGEWFMFLGRDSDFYNVEYQGEEHGVYSTSTHCIFRVEEGKVGSVSRYRDFRQYNGETPRSLALTMLRIQAKYGAAGGELL